MTEEAGLGTKLDKVLEVVTDIRVHLASLEEQTTANSNSRRDHENRLRVLESWRWKVLGWVAAIGGVVAVAAHRISVVFFGEGR